MAKKSREDYLRRCADMLCESAYKLVREGTAGKAVSDAKGLKELCAAVKEAVAVANSLQTENNTDGVQIVMDEAAEKYGG